MVADSGTQTPPCLTRIPTPLSNFLELLYILLISAALTHTFGRMVKDERQGWALYAAMSVLFLAGVLVCCWAEGSGNPQFAALGLDPANMEGKEVRFGIANSSLWAVASSSSPSTQRRATRRDEGYARAVGREDHLSLLRGGLR